MQMTIMHTAI